MRALMFRYFKWMFIPALAALLSLTAIPAFAGSDMLFTGGGFIKDGNGAAAKRISFSVNLYVDTNGISAGHLGFHFHNLDDSYGLDQSHFSTTEFESVFVEARYSEDAAAPFTFVRIEAGGRLDGMDGWSVLVRFTDYGAPARNKSLLHGYADSLRVMLFDPSGVAVYDTALDYPREQSWRTLLDGGNVSVNMRFVPDP